MILGCEVNLAMSNCRAGEIKEEFTVYSLDGWCVIKASMVECQLIPSINTLDRLSIKTQSTNHQHLCLHSINTSVDRQSTNFWSFHMSQLTLKDVYQPRVHQVSTEHQSGCTVSIDQDVDWGYRLRESIVHKKICLL